MNSELQYHPTVRWWLVMYVVGALVGLWRTDAAWPTRVAIALLWPIGPIAFVITFSILLAASVIAFPMFAIGAVAAGGLFWWVYSFLSA